MSSIHLKTKYVYPSGFKHMGKNRLKVATDTIEDREDRHQFGKNLNSQLTAILVVILQLLFLLLLDQQVHGITASLLTFPPQVRWIYKTKYTHRVVGTYDRVFGFNLNNIFDSIGKSYATLKIE